MTMTKGRQQRLKRCFDVAVAAPVLVVLSPALAGIAVVVRLDSRGPALFRQERVGRDGVIFRIHKFRTMRAVHDGALVSAAGDARVTRAGRFLRRAKLDELPQLLDVLAGHMSLVGPRPEVPMYAALWPAERSRVILSVRPGLTDPASVRFRNEADLLAGVPDPNRYYTEVLIPEKTRLYVEYVRSQTFTGDLKILWATAAALFRRS